MTAPVPTLRCEVPESSSDLVITLLFEAGATAVSERDMPGGVELRAGFESTQAATAAIAKLGGRGSARLEAVAGDDWVLSQRQWIDPIRVGRFSVRAPWHESSAPIDPDEIALVIDPGTAFGHGGHPTTSLLLEMIPGLIEPNLTVVDVGTGTGVLAIAAAMLGGGVTAVDTDPAALDVARANVIGNGVEDEVVVQAATPSTPLAADLALVNLTISGHRAVAPRLGSTPIVAASGILDHQLDELLELYLPRSATVTNRSSDWIATVLT